LITILCLIFMQKIDLEPQIREPQHGAYLSGKVEIVIDCHDPKKVSRLELRGNEQVLVQMKGWKDKLVYDFGDQILAWRLALHVWDIEGNEFRSEAIITRALHIDVEETTRIILIPVVVKDRKNRHVTKLVEKQFQVFQDGEPCKIRLIERQTVPLNIALLVDGSSSLRKTEEVLKNSVLEFVSQLEAKDKCALISFSYEPELIFGFEAKPEEIESKINSIKPKGATAMFDALLLGEKELRSLPRSRKTIVLFTDGRDSIYEEVEDKRRLFKEVVHHAQIDETAIFAIGLGGNIHHEALQLMAEDTGGRFLFAESAGDLQSRFKEVLDDLKNQYVLHVEPVSQSKGFHRLEVIVKKNRTRVFARKGFYIE